MPREPSVASVASETVPDPFARIGLPMTTMSVAPAMVSIENDWLAAPLVTCPP